MFKRLLLLGLVSGALAGLAALIYQKVYFKANEADFSAIVTPAKIFIGGILINLLASVVYGLLIKWAPKTGDILFNLLFVILTFAAIVVPIGYILPLDYEQPELFPGLTVPMLFFPALAWFTFKPVFIKK
ncbi:hypothetical protein [Longitalea arenae]|uniref:hypothetical protein n=1 Tax=Longitalea arenae TaxID=2812558 RepID=UPI001968771A|nr:hypothetical protein [Longitalea arenae]